ncbi:MAG TPA: HypC/HybG/HupF family hydrogenase formation chaperone [bacterium]|nr:HypC/HybG/HupF family hydrogenase formation chaperone [bacterium]HPN33347.1 HypC/HybG/HupF family hydrogenase formation chaperone [bacterium]
MCLAIPGRVESLEQQDGMLMGRVDFNGINKMVCLAYVPEVQIGQQVMVHAGFAIQIVDEEEVRQFHQLWQQVLDHTSDRRQER